jgi:predicted  nucleic acid-binding Zn-ribbon protein
VTTGQVARLEAEARYHRERLALYRARAYGSDTTTPRRLRELERVATQAEERLRSVREKNTVQ